MVRIAKTLIIEANKINKIYFFYFLFNYDNFYNNYKDFSKFTLENIYQSFSGLPSLDMKQISKLQIINTNLTIFKNFSNDINEGLGLLAKELYRNYMLNLARYQFDVKAQFSRFQYQNDSLKRVHPNIK